MSNEEILQVIDQRNEDLKNLIQLQARLTSSEIESLGLVLKADMKKMHEKQDKTNGSLGRHDGRISEVEKTVTPLSWARKNWKAACITGFALFYGVHLLIEKVSIVSIIKFFK